MAPDPPQARVEPAALRGARLASHWAVQALAAVAEKHLTHAADDSHTSLQWLGSKQAFARRELGGSRRVALQIPGLRLLLLGEPAEVSFEWEGKILQEGLDWLSAALGGGPLHRPTHEMPEHPVGQRASFEADPEALAALAQWYGFGEELLRELSSRAPEAGPLRCWPHHFDLATLLRLDETRSIGVGLSPGDSGCEEPYFYVTPWPYPKGASRPQLEGRGAWHLEGWVGAFLRASRVVSGGETKAFLDSALAACRALLVVGA